MEIRTALAKVNGELAAQAERKDAANATLERLGQYSEALQAARYSGDPALYRKLMEEYEAAEAGLPDQSEEITPSYTAEQLAALWQTEAKSYNKEFLKLRAEYDKARKSCCEIFKRLLALQNKALSLRFQTGQTIIQLNGELESFRAKNPDRDMQKMAMRCDSARLGLAGLELLPKKEPVRCHTGSVYGCFGYPDAVYFISSGDLPESQLPRVTRIVSNETPLDE